MTAILPLAAFARRRSPPAPLRAAQAAAWRPGLGEGIRHAEVFAAAGEGSGAGLALALALDAAAAGEARPFLWVQDGAALRLSGRPYRPGLPAALRHRLIHVAARSVADALFALEEGLRCRDLAFVLGEVAGNPRALDFTASRRLSLAAEKHGTPLWLVRLDAQRDLSSARLRWAARAAPSLAPRWDEHAPGHPAWQAELFRARSHPPGQWVLCLENGQLVSSPLPERGEDTKAWPRSGLAAVGEGLATSRTQNTPLQAALAGRPASCAILSPPGERAGG